MDNGLGLGRKVRGVWLEVVGAVPVDVAARGKKPGSAVKVPAQKVGQRRSIDAARNLMEETAAGQGLRADPWLVSQTRHRSPLNRCKETPRSLRECDRKCPTLAGLRHPGPTPGCRTDCQSVLRSAGCRTDCHSVLPSAERTTCAWPIDQST